MTTLDKIKTKKQLLYLNMLLTQLLASENQNISKYKQKIFENYNITIPEFLDYFQLQKYASALEKQLELFKVITLHIAITPNDSFISELHDFFKKYVKKDFVLDFVIDPTIMGGVILEIDGYYMNLSIRSKLKNVSVGSYVS